MAEVFTFVSEYKSHLLWGVAFVVGVVLVGMSVGKPIIHRNIPVGDATAPTSTSLTLSGPALNDSLPIRLSIPKLSIDTTFTEPLGLDEKTSEVSIPETFGGCMGCEAWTKPFGA